MSTINVTARIGAPLGPVPGQQDPVQQSPVQAPPQQQPPAWPLPQLPSSPIPGPPAPPPMQGEPLPLPPSGPPQVPPPGTTPGRPQPPTQGPGPKQPPSEQPPDIEPPTKDPDAGGGFDLKPLLIGAGVVGAGVLAIRSGARNVRALKATAAAYGSGAMHQGGLQSIRDAQLGARFANGIGTKEYLQVALPGINRIGTGGRLTAVARGHLDHAELLASATALRRVSSEGGVRVHEPLRRHVLDQLERGHGLPSVLDDLDRSAAGARPAFDNPQLARYWDRTAIVEQGRRSGGAHVTAGVSADRAQLALVDGAIVETGRPVRINELVAGRGADLGGRGLADGIGTIQGVNVSTLHPKLQAKAIATSGVDPALVEARGLNAAFTQRWHDRLAMGAADAASDAARTSA